MDVIRISCLILISSAMLAAQSITVSGKVTDFNSGEDLPGVNVFLKGTSTGVTTNLYGEYSIKVPSLKGTLIFSYIGMEKKEVAIKGRNVIDVQLEADVAQLSEVVVTGRPARNFSHKEKRQAIRQIKHISLQIWNYLMVKQTLRITKVLMKILFRKLPKIRCPLFP